MERLFLNYSTACPSADEKGCEQLTLMVELFAKLSPAGQDSTLVRLEAELREQAADDAAAEVACLRGTA